MTEWLRDGDTLVNQRFPTIYRYHSDGPVYEYYPFRWNATGMIDLATGKAMKPDFKKTDGNLVLETTYGSALTGNIAWRVIVNERMMEDDPSLFVELRRKRINGCLLKLPDRTYRMLADRRVMNGLRWAVPDWHHDRALSGVFADLIPSKMLEDEIQRMLDGHQ